MRRQTNQNQTNPDKRRIGVIGAGGWGLALANVLALRHDDIIVWAYEEEELCALRETRESKTFLPGVTINEKIRYTSDYGEAVKDREFVLIVTPSFAYKAACLGIAPYLEKGTIVVSCTKGLEPHTARRLSLVAKDALPSGAKISTLSGPSHAEEVSRLAPTAVVIGAKRRAIARKVRDALIVPPYFRTYASDDHIGVELGGSLKNVIALAAGILDGLKLGDNAKAALITRGLAEIVRFGVSAGAKKKTFYGLAGLGDLIVTCDSVHSRNRRVGEMIAEGHNYESIKREMKQVAEGVYAARAAWEYAQRNRISMPITEAVYKTLFENANVRESAMGLMSRSAKDE